MLNSDIKVSENKDGRRFLIVILRAKPKNFKKMQKPIKILITVVLLTAITLAGIWLWQQSAQTARDSNPLGNRYLKEEDFYQRYGVSPEGLVLWLDQSDPRSYGDSANWYDMSGQGNHGSQTTGANQPGIVSGSGFAGFARSFDGSDDYLGAGDIGSIKTISFWIKPDSTTEKLMGLAPSAWTCGTDTVTDDESNTYNTVEIGTQCWFAENIDIGDPVCTIGGNEDGDGNDNTCTLNMSDDSNFEKYCYLNLASNCATYGGLYQWNETMQYTTTEGARGICPAGWHIPTDAEWYTLESYLWTTGACAADRTTWGCEPAGTALKTGGSSNFDALLAGNRNTDGSFSDLTSDTRLWSSLQSGSGAWRRYLHSGYVTVYRSTSTKAGGFSVRCLKDSGGGGGTYSEVSSGTISASGFTSPTIYVDGVESSAIDTDWHLVAITTDTAVDASDVNIGKVDSDFFDGIITEVRIYNRALSAAEIEKLYLADKPRYGGM